jgi:hypothetical protein
VIPIPDRKLARSIFKQWVTQTRQEVWRRAGKGETATSDVQVKNLAAYAQRWKKTQEQAGNSRQVKA